MIIMMIFKSWDLYFFSLKLTTISFSASLHVKGKKFCVNPWNIKVKKMMKKMKHKIHRSKSHVRKQREPELSNRKTRSSSKWSKTHDEDTVAYGTAGKDTRFHEWWMIVALKWLFKSLCARESRGRKHHLYSKWCWPDYQTNDKEFLIMSCSKCSLYLLDLWQTWICLSFTLLLWQPPLRFLF